MIRASNAILHLWMRTPSHLAAARRTIGVSSAPNAAKDLRSSSWIVGGTFGYTAGYNAAEDVRDVNHSPCESRFSKGM